MTVRQANCCQCSRGLGSKGKGRMIGLQTIIHQLEHRRDLQDTRGLAVDLLPLPGIVRLRLQFFSEGAYVEVVLRRTLNFESSFSHIVLPARSGFEDNLLDDRQRRTVNVSDL